MTSIFLYNETYYPGHTLQNLTIQEVQDKFGFEYIESNLSTTLKHCSLPEWMKSYKVIDKPEKYMAIHKTCPNKNMGWGIVATSNIPKKTIVLEYAGVKNKKAGIYGINLDGTTAIDAKTKGNLARFFQYFPTEQPLHEENSIKLANLYVEKVECQNESHFIFITRESINPGQELSWDYGNAYRSNLPAFYFVDKKTNKCFLGSVTMSGDPIKEYTAQIKELSDVIKGCKDVLKTNPNNQSVINHLTTTFFLRGETNFALEKYSEAIKDFKTVFDIDLPLTLVRKAQYLALLAKTYQNKLSQSIEFDDENCPDNMIIDINNKIKSTIDSDKNNLIDQLPIVVSNYSQYKCVQDWYDAQVAISEQLLVYTNRHAGFCTAEQNDVLSISNDGLLGAICNLKNGYETYDYDIFATNCRPLIKLSETEITHDWG